MSERNSCETCPYLNIPLEDTDKWQAVKAAQATFTPEYTAATNKHLIDVEMQMRVGTEANTRDCPGYSTIKAIANFALDKLAGSDKPHDTGQGVRQIKWPERTCNNPFLLTGEYAELSAELTKPSVAAFDQTQRAAI